MVDAYVDGDVDGDFEFRPGEVVGVQAEDARAVERDRLFRDVLGRFATGVTVVTGLLDGRAVRADLPVLHERLARPAAGAVLPGADLAGVAADPALRHFCVNILAADQVEVSRTMASRGTDKFAGVDWSPSTATGSPVLAGTLGFVDATISSVHEAGDHFVVVGRVLDLEAAGHGPPAAVLPRGVRHDRGLRPGASALRPSSACSGRSGV